MRAAFPGYVAGLLVGLALAGGQPLHGGSNYSVGGIVVDSRSHPPLANARVSLAPTTAREQKLEQVTKQDGRFAFPVSEPGKYSLAMAKQGYPPQAYKQAGYAAVSSAIVVRDDQNTDSLVFEARRGSAITGLVKDEDSEPVSGALVAIYQSAIVDGDRRIISRGQTRANAAGEFRLSGLPRGNYYICAMGRPWFADSLIQLQEMPRSVDRFHRGIPQVASDEEPEGPIRSAPKFSPDPSVRGTAFRTTFYPGVPSVDQASLVTLEAGDEVRISITLPLTTAVSVKATLEVPGETSEGRATLNKKVHDHYVSFLDGWVGKDGTIQFSNVPAGSYEIVAASHAGTGASSWYIRETVEVGGSDLEIALKPQPMGTLSGRVVYEGKRPALLGDLFVYAHNEEGNAVRTQVNPDGSFSLSRLRPGQYDVTAGNPEYMAGFFTGPGGERLPLTLAISSGETVRRDLTLTRAVAAIEGTVESEGVPRVGAFVLLMPKDSSHRWAYRVDQTDSDGSYRLRTIPSGDYFLIAVSSGDDVAFRNAKIAAILSGAAQTVHVDAGDHMDLKLDLVDTTALRLPPL